MNPEELKKQLEDVEKKKKRTALLLSLGFAVLAVIVIFSIYTAFVKNTSKERSETTKYSLFERIFGAGNTPTTTNTSQQQSTDSTKQITGSKSALGTTFTSLTQKWLEGYKKNVNIQSTNIVRPLAVSMAIFDDPAYVKKYGKINKESATLEDISQAIEFSRTKKVEIKDQLDVLQNQFDGYTGDLAAETKSLEQLKKQLSDLEKSDGASVAQKILTTEERIKIQSQIDAINKNIATLEAYIKSHPNDPTSILDAKKAQIVSLKNELLLLQSKLNSTPNSNFTKNAQIQSLQKQIQVLEKNLTGYNQIGTAVSGQISSLKNQYTGIEKQISTFESVSGSLKDQIESYYKEYSQLDIQTKNYINQIKNFNLQILRVDPMLKKLSPQLISFISQFGLLKLQNITFEKQISTLYAQVSFLHLQVTSLVNTKTPVTLSSLKVPIFTVKYQIGALSNGITEIKPYLVSFISSTKGVWDSLGTLQPQVSTILLQLDYNNDGKLSSTDYSQQVDPSKFTGTQWKQIVALCDINKDGKVTVSEISKALETDYNGVLSKLNLVKQFDAYLLQVQSKVNQIDKNNLTGNSWKQILAAYDTDGDGKISIKEKEYAISTDLVNIISKLGWVKQLDSSEFTGNSGKKIIAAYDMNKDGKVSIKEMQDAIDSNYQDVLAALQIEKQLDKTKFTGVSWEDFKKAYDTNKDGTVTALEFRSEIDSGNISIFKKMEAGLQLDINKDGKVTENEVTGITWSSFRKAFDSNNDGFVSVLEMNNQYDTNFAQVTKTLGLIGQLDANGDGRILENDFEGVSVRRLIYEFDGVIPRSARDGFVSVDEISYGLSKNVNNVFERLGYVHQLDVDGNNVIDRPYFNIFGNYVVDRNELTNVADTNGDGVFERCFYHDMYGNCIPEGFIQRDNNQIFNARLGVYQTSDYLEADADGDGTINPCYYIDNERHCVIEGYSPNNYNYNGSPDYFFQYDTNGDNVYDEKDAFDPYMFIYKKSGQLPVYVSQEESWFDEQTGRAQIVVAINYTPGETIVKNITLELWAYKYDPETRKSTNERRISTPCSTSQTSSIYEQYKKDKIKVSDIQYCYFETGVGAISKDEYFDVDAIVVGPTSISKRPEFINTLLNITDPLKNFPLVTYGQSKITIDSFNKVSEISMPESKWYYFTGYTTPSQSNPLPTQTKSELYMFRDVCLEAAKQSTGGSTQPPCYREIVSKAKFYYITSLSPSTVKSAQYDTLAACTVAAQAQKSSDKIKKDAEDKIKIEALKKKGILPVLGNSYNALTYGCINAANDPANNSITNQRNAGDEEAIQSINGLNYAYKEDQKSRTDKSSTILFTAFSVTPASFISKDTKASGYTSVVFTYWKEGGSKASQYTDVSIRKNNSGSTYKGSYDSFKVFGSPGDIIYYEFTNDSTEKETLSGIRTLKLMTTSEYEASKDSTKSPVNQSMYQEVSAAAPTFNGFDILKQGIVFCGYDGYWPVYDPNSKRFNFTLPAAFVANPEKYGIKPEKVKQYAKGGVLGEAAQVLTFKADQKEATYVKAYNRQVDENELCSWAHAISTFNRIINIVLKLFIPMAIGIMVMIIGIQYLIAAYRGKVVEITQYKKALWRILGGTILILMSFVIVKMIVVKLNQEEWFGQFIDVTGSAKTTPPATKPPTGS